MPQPEIAAAAVTRFTNAYLTHIWSETPSDYGGRCEAAGATPELARTITLTDTLIPNLQRTALREIQAPTAVTVTLTDAGDPTRLGFNVTGQVTITTDGGRPIPHTLYLLVQAVQQPDGTWLIGSVTA